MKNISEMTDSEFSSFIRETVKSFEDGTVSEATEAARIFRDAGVVKNIHVGSKKEFTPRERMEWFVGQFLEIVDSEGWFAVNSYINCTDKFTELK